MIPGFASRDWPELLFDDRLWSLVGKPPGVVASSNNGLVSFPANARSTCRTVTREGSSSWLAFPGPVEEGLFPRRIVSDLLPSQNTGSGPLLCGIFNSRAGQLCGTTSSIVALSSPSTFFSCFLHCDIGVWLDSPVRRRSSGSFDTRFRLALVQGTGSSTGSNFDVDGSVMWRSRGHCSVSGSGS